MSDYFILIPAQVRCDKELLPLDKLIFGEIASLSQGSGFCWAQNATFADVYAVRPETVSRSLKKLRERGYIEIAFDGKGNSGRKIFPVDLCVKTYDAEIKGLDGEVNAPLTHRSKTLDAQVKHNIKITKEGTYSADAQTHKRFYPPTVEDVAAYCAARGNGVDAQRFIDHYSAVGWKVGKSPMRDWKAAVRTWERRENAATESLSPSIPRLRVELDENGKEICVFDD